MFATLPRYNFNTKAHRRRFVGAFVILSA